MSAYQDDGDADLAGQFELDQTLASIISLGSQVAARAATETFHSVMLRPGWTSADVEAEIEHSICKMDIAARDAIMVAGADPESEHWAMVWSAMQRSYRKAVAELMDASEPQIIEAIH